MIRFPRATAVLAVVLVLAGAAACGDGNDGDLEAFCEAVDALRDENPFEELEIASPEEMRDAFAQLSEGAERIAGQAPSEAERQAEAYRDSVDELTDQLRGAGFDPRNVDALSYGRAVDDYQEAAASVDNTADSLCP